MSEITAITCEAEYEAALLQMDELWGAKAGSRAAKQLERLATMIDEYETDRLALDDPSDAKAMK